MNQDWLPRVFIDTDPELKATIFGPPRLLKRTADRIREVMRGIDRKALDAAGRERLKRRILEVLEQQEAEQDGE